MRAPILSAWQAGVICARGISAVWLGPAGDTRAVGGRHTFLGEQECLHLGECGVRTCAVAKTHCIMDPSQLICKLYPDF